jgi:hypothetical protein
MIKIVNKQNVVTAYGRDQSTMNHPKALVNDIRTAVSVRPLGRWEASISGEHTTIETDGFLLGTTSPVSALIRVLRRKAAQFARKEPAKTCLWMDRKSSPSTGRPLSPVNRPPWLRNSPCDLAGPLRGENSLAEYFRAAVLASH